MARRSAPRTIDEYISAAPTGCQPILEKIRTIIRQNAARAKEAISYGMPAFKQEGILVYFAVFKKHIGLFPPVRGDEKLKRAAAPYAGPKGNLQLPLEEPIPYDLIRRIVKARVLATGGESRRTQK
jgi:uncharacterized protein YdhG (YjbR/CyaY superfamily)